MRGGAVYFGNHARRNRFPWTLYHGELDRRIGRILTTVVAQPRVLVAGCGLDPSVPNRPDAIVYGSDLDPRAIETCAARFPHLSDRLATCPDGYTQPNFGVRFDAIIAKEVVEHVLEPERWVAGLTSQLEPGGLLILTTPNYGSDSSLALLERTVLSWIARRDGYSRADIHPTKFDVRRLTELDVGESARLLRVEVALTRWSLVGVWRRT